MPESRKVSPSPDAASGPAAQEVGRAEPLATDRDEHGAPLHRGWAPLSGRRRWVEPFVLALLARGCTYGYAVIGRLDDMRVSNGPVDAGLVYRTLQDLERSGQVRSSWSDEATGPRRRAYEITDAGYRALDEWAAVMRERARLIGEFNADYLAIVSAPRPHAR